jgi:hypothetical protein
LAVAIKNDAARSGDLFRPLLLMLCALFEFAVGKNLEIDQAKADYAAPQDKRAREEIKAKVRIAGSRGGHEISSDKYGGRLAALFERTRL